MDIAELGMLLDTMQPGAPSQEEFERAAELARQQKGLDNDQKLQLYGLYKQSTIGNVNCARPWSIDFTGAAKWDAWKSYEGFPKESAAKAYVYIVTEILAKESAAASGDSKNTADCMGVTVSTLNNSTPSVPWSESHRIFSAVVDNDIDQLNALAATNSLQLGDINLRDEHGMTPLHFAADRGYNNVVQWLLDHGADINALDNDNQSPLALAVCCEHQDVIDTLVRMGSHPVSDMPNIEGDK